MKKLLVLTLAVSILFGLLADSVSCSAKQTLNAASSNKFALIRLEDVSPWYALDEKELQKLYKIADYLYLQNVPFSVSLIPVYTNPKEKIYLSIEDKNDERIKKFIAAIKYMELKGGVVGLHGYTHQHGDGITAADFEFSSDPKLEIGSVSYMKERVTKALEICKEAGITISYWETPHYTASFEQYKYLESVFPIIYQPYPYEKYVKNVRLVTSSNKSIGNVIYVPTPLGMVKNIISVKFLIGFANHPKANVLASFFFHPFREGFDIKHPFSSGYFLEKIIPAFKKNDFRFITPVELRKLVLEGKFRQ